MTFLEKINNIEKFLNETIETNIKTNYIIFDLLFDNIDSFEKLKLKDRIITNDIFLCGRLKNINFYIDANLKIDELVLKDLNNNILLDLNVFKVVENEFNYEIKLI